VLGGLWVAQRLEADTLEAAELQRSAITADAVVTRVRRPGGNDSQVTAYYRYTAASREYQGQTRLRKRDPMWRTIATGTRIRVVYLPSRPDRSWLEGRGPRERPQWMAVIVPVVCVPLALLLAAILQYQRRLLEDGRAVMASVTSAEKKSKSEDSWRIVYSWHLLNGATRTAHVDRSAQPAGAGAFLPVIYDADRPERHATYPLSLVKLR